MEALAQELIKKLGGICTTYYYKKTNIMEEAEKLSGDIRQFVELLIQTLSEQEDSEESAALQNYAVQIWNDYVEAVNNKDIVLMVDTLDFGLWDLLEDLFRPDKNEEEDREKENE